MDMAIGLAESAYILQAMYTHARSCTSLYLTDATQLVLNPISNLPLGPTLTLT